MTARKTNERAGMGASPKAVDVVDGVPDRTAKARWWQYALIAVVFAGWLAFLVYCWLAGGVDR